MVRRHYGIFLMLAATDTLMHGILKFKPTQLQRRQKHG